MTLSPLQLKRYYVEEFACKANPDFKKKAEINTKGFQVYFESGVNEKDNLKRRIRLTITQDISPDGNEPYSFKVVMVAFFEIIKEFFDKQGAEKVEQLVNANGPALLYSAARELLALISSRGPYTDKELDVFLPSITFINFKPMKRPPEEVEPKGVKRPPRKTKK